MSDWKKRPFTSMEEACRASLIECRREVSPGRFTLADAVDGERVGKGAGRVFVFADGRGGIAFNWRTGERALWFLDAGTPLSPAEEKRRQAKAARAMRRLETERIHRQKEAAQFAESLLHLSRPAEKVGHAYLRRKGVKPVPQIGVLEASVIREAFAEFYTGDRKHGPLWDDKTNQRMVGPVLIVPLYGNLRLNRIVSLEFISEAGGKRTLPESRARGALWLPDSARLSAIPPRLIGVAEGLATALSVSQVKGIPVAAARSCNNLLPAARLLRERFRSCHLIVLGDIGRGEEHARKAARQVCGTDVLFPAFPPVLLDRFRSRTGSNSAPTDWNDYYLALGAL